MKKIIVLLILILASGCSSIDQSIYKNITINEAKNLIKEEKSLVIIDLRSDLEYQEGYIENAKSIPIENVNKHIDEILIYKDTPILLYCRNQQKSLEAMNILKEKGFKKLYRMYGGMSNWDGKIIIPE